jgi:hypothetical protein
MLLEDQTTYTMVGDNSGWLFSVTDASNQPSPEFSLPTAVRFTTNCLIYCLILFKDILYQLIGLSLRSYDLWVPL